MKTFIGQLKLKYTLETMTLDTLPHSFILAGDYGCGKHTYINLIADKFNLPIIDMTKNIKLSYIDTIYSTVLPTVYIIDQTSSDHIITEKEQNIILKFLEEPLTNVFICILVTNVDNLIATVQNRCQQFVFEKYSKEILYNLAENKNIDLSFVETPGQLLALEACDYNELNKLTSNMIYKMNVASLPNALSILSKLRFSNSDGIDPYILLKSLLHSITNMIIENDNPFLYKMYEITSETFTKYNFGHVNTLNIMQNYIINIWSLAHNI